jgi:hypothetical protein
MFAVFVLSALLHAQTANAFGAAGDVATLRASMGVRQLRVLADDRIARAAEHGAADLFVTAELLKQLGDPQAAEFYERAIAANEAEPAYELFYADYLRNFRGPRRPLFAEAERHYIAALGKLREGDDVVRERVDRGLVALYQEDGIPFHWRGDGAPALFVSLTERFARSPADLDEVHDTRDFTSEALFSASVERRNIALTDDDLRALVRIKEPRETAVRLRGRAGGWPVIDVFFRSRSIGSAAVTDFHDPRSFNDVDLRTFGVAAEKTIGLARWDWYFRAGLSKQNRTGVIELFPEADESIGQLDLQASAARFIGPDKLNVDACFASQEIEPETADPPRRERRIGGATVEYQILRPLPFLRNPYGQLFETRGIGLVAGFANDRERFGTVDVTRHDYFLGLSFRGLGPFDVTLQPGYSDSRVSGDRSQTNAQFRTDATVLVRLVDEESAPGIPKLRFLGLPLAFVHLVFPYKRDLSREGLEALENDRYGAALNAKFLHRALPAAGPARTMRPWTILASIRYEQQRFPRLDETLNLFGVSLSVGY